MKTLKTFVPITSKNSASGDDRRAGSARKKQNIDCTTWKSTAGKVRIDCMYTVQPRKDRNYFTHGLQISIIPTGSALVVIMVQPKAINSTTCTYVNCCPSLCEYILTVLPCIAVNCNTFGCTS